MMSCGGPETQSKLTDSYLPHHFFVVYAYSQILLTQRSWVSMESIEPMVNPLV